MEYTPEQNAIAKTIIDNILAERTPRMQPKRGMKITLDLEKFIEHMRFLRDVKSTDGKHVEFDHVVNYFPNVHPRTVKWDEFAKLTGRPHLQLETTESGAKKEGRR